MKTFKEYLIEDKFENFNFKKKQWNSFATDYKNLTAAEFTLKKFKKEGYDPRQAIVAYKRNISDLSKLSNDDKKYLISLAVMKTRSDHNTEIEGDVPDQKFKPEYAKKLIKDIKIPDFETMVKNIEKQIIKPEVAKARESQNKEIEDKTKKVSQDVKTKKVDNNSSNDEPNNQDSSNEEPNNQNSSNDEPNNQVSSKTVDNVKPETSKIEKGNYAQDASERIQDILYDVDQGIKNLSSKLENEKSETNRAVLSKKLKNYNKARRKINTQLKKAITARKGYEDRPTTNSKINAERDATIAVNTAEHLSTSLGLKQELAELPSKAQIAGQRFKDASSKLKSKLNSIKDSDAARNVKITGEKVKNATLKAGEAYNRAAQRGVEAGERRDALYKDKLEKEKQEALKKVKDNIKEPKENIIKNTASNVGNTVKTAANKAGNSISNTASNIGSNVKNVSNKIGSSVKNTVSNANTVLKNRVKKQNVVNNTSNVKTLNKINNNLKQDAQQFKYKKAKLEDDPDEVKKIQSTNLALRDKYRKQN